MDPVTIRNDTNYIFSIDGRLRRIFENLNHLAVGGRCKILTDIWETDREYRFEVEDIEATLTISSNNFLEWSQISIQEGPDGSIIWRGTKPREEEEDTTCAMNCDYTHFGAVGFSQAELTHLHALGLMSELGHRGQENTSFSPLADVDLAHELAKEVSLKFDEALRSCDSLEKLLKTVKICRHQCNHLVQTFKERIQKMVQLYSLLLNEYWQIGSYYFDDMLLKLGNSLDRLEDIICDTKGLLGSCAEGLGKVALVVSCSRPPVEKDGEVYSDFDRLIRELQWEFDLIEYLIEEPGSAELVWSPTNRRYVLERSEGNENVVAQEEGADENRPRNLAYLDRKELQSGLEDGSIFTPDSVFGWCKWRFYNLSSIFGSCKGRFYVLGEKNLHSTILERCKAHGDLNDFEINHLDIYPSIYRPLGEGAFKIIYEGKWYTQSVAIATIRMDDPDKSQLLSKGFKDEVKRLLQLQHPKVVSFYGWAETNDAPEPIKQPDDLHPVQGGYLVTEKMECDLDKLIRRQKIVRRNVGGGSFAPSVAVDILQQIVEAMLHVQKKGFFHRDLKPKNFLVNSRPSAKPRADTYYNVKLIDFGSSKLYVGEDANTYNVGTTSYAAPEMMKGSEKEADRGKYDSSVDVFSFGMTCYEVITGKKPFHDTNAAKALKNKERPKFPQTVLQGLKELTEACWHETPTERPSFEEIQKSLWTMKVGLAVE